MTTDEKVAKVIWLAEELYLVKTSNAYSALESAIRELADPVKVPKGFVERLRERNKIDCDIAATILEKLPKECE